MRSLFFRTLAAFLCALLIFSLIQAAVFLWGYRRSLETWSKAKRDAVEELAGRILDGPVPEGDALEVPQDVPIFIYNERKELIFSNRGQGRRRAAQVPDAELIPITREGKLLGYYSTSLLHFQDDSANTLFLQSMSRYSWAALISSFLLAFVFAFFFSQGLARQARRAAAGLEGMAHGNLGLHLPEEGTAELAQIARSANRLARQLAREQELRRQWAQDVAHDLRTPLAALRAQLEGIKEGILAASEERIARNLRELSRVERLVGDLEELTRLESPELKLKKSTVDGRRFLQELAERFQPELSGKKVRLETTSSIGTLRVDEALLLRAVSNLLANSVRHTPAGGRISVSLEKEGAAVLIRVSDNGEGIPEQDLDKVFDRLYRGEYARLTPGSGLGLTIVKRIVELHGGTVALSSKVGEGTTVLIRLG